MILGNVFQPKITFYEKDNGYMTGNRDEIINIWYIYIYFKQLLNLDRNDETMGDNLEIL